MARDLELICPVWDKGPSRHHLSPPPSPKLLIPHGIVSTDSDHEDTIVCSEEIRKHAEVESSVSGSDPVAPQRELLGEAVITTAAQIHLGWEGTCLYEHPSGFKGPVCEIEVKGI